MIAYSFGHAYRYFFGRLRLRSVGGENIASMVSDCDVDMDIQEFLHFVQEDRARWVVNALGPEHLTRIVDVVGQAPLFSLQLSS